MTFCHYINFSICANFGIKSGDKKIFVQTGKLIISLSSKGNKKMGYYKSIDEIKRANKEKGHHFFDSDTMRFFRSRILSYIEENYFITSEKFDDGSPRVYTVRIALEDGTIHSVSEFQQFKTIAQAKAFIKKLVENGENNK